jgi:hypothetical protein
VKAYTVRKAVSQANFPPLIVLEGPMLSSGIDFFEIIWDNPLPMNPVCRVYNSRIKLTLRSISRPGSEKESSRPRIWGTSVRNYKRLAGNGEFLLAENADVDGLTSSFSNTQQR